MPVSRSVVGMMSGVSILEAVQSLLRARQHLHQNEVGTKLHGVFARAADRASILRRWLVTCRLCRTGADIRRDAAGKELTGPPCPTPQPLRPNWELSESRGPEADPKSDPSLKQPRKNRNYAI